MGIERLQEEIVTEEIENLRSLVRSVKKEASIFLLENKYGQGNLLSQTIFQIAALIENLPEKKSIIEDLVNVKQYSSMVHEETFINLAEKYKIDMHFDEPLKLIVTKCYCSLPLEKFNKMCVIASVNKEKQYEVLRGKMIEKTLEFDEQDKRDIETAMGNLVEAGRNYIINLEKVNDDIIMTAHFETRTRTFTTIKSGKTIATINVKPTTRASAKYNIKENRISLRYGTSNKIRNAMLESFGQVFFKDNNHFKGDSYQIYKLDDVKNDDFSIRIDEELQDKVLSANIIEETLKFNLEDNEVVLVVKSKDVEETLELLSNEHVQLKAQPRESVVIQIKIKDGEQQDKIKTLKVKISSNSKIHFDPRYTEIVHKCLQNWGIEIGS
ncbi:hypothetical protein ACQVUL_04635 [Bacillus cytotoxicus]|uniref:Uncharacterized protein n=1 Tax=Bacillus cytotoxicus (strain DSM 22905 / CIP 110041 / 391-98 / NVH 391-98) TaxID=315749 RepID=A7GLT8_BACCN|nr:MULTISPECIES: hypothetical protein [Bacillus cereus group]ABS21096.1 hypothetical protein Bcer98_0756 [Bacillus cytotoxicus NVH 391-98]AWC43827.1 hypothetical protein CG479_004380 [Bacillus cytotoxicus]MDH2863995.1 hypothetical protein [Bacillus cytotoxicus]MDH2883605.1 hypothetical protein [Bacillus cytotoxicus]NZD31229.1 hypothetical protein [Bacillus cytotoxicus]